MLSDPRTTHKSIDGITITAVHNQGSLQPSHTPSFRAEKSRSSCGRRRALFYDIRPRGELFVQVGFGRRSERVLKINDFSGRIKSPSRAPSARTICLYALFALHSICVYNAPSPADFVDGMNRAGLVALHVLDLR